MANDESTQKYVRSLFNYRDGELYWKVARQGRKLGVPAGGISLDGYRVIRINGKLYRSHRLIFLYHHGYLPEFLDHIDGVRLNNNINNLREATKQENSMNMKSPNLTMVNQHHQNIKEFIGINKPKNGKLKFGLMVN